MYGLMPTMLLECCHDKMFNIDFFCTLLFDIIHSKWNYTYIYQINFVFYKAPSFLFEIGVHLCPVYTSVTKIIKISLILTWSYSFRNCRFMLARDEMIELEPLERSLFIVNILCQENWETLYGNSAVTGQKYICVMKSWFNTTGSHMCLQCIMQWLTYV